MRRFFSAFLAIFSNFLVDRSHAYTVESFFFNMLVNFVHNGIWLDEILQVFLNAHDDSLRFAALVYDEAFLVLSNTPENLSELCAGGKRWNDSRNAPWASCFGHALAFELIN